MLLLGGKIVAAGLLVVLAATGLMWTAPPEVHTGCEGTRCTEEPSTAVSVAMDTLYDDTMLPLLPLTKVPDAMLFCEFTVRGRVAPRIGAGKRMFDALLRRARRPGSEQWGVMCPVHHGIDTIAVAWNDTDVGAAGNAGIIMCNVEDIDIQVAADRPLFSHVVRSGALERSLLLRDTTPVDIVVHTSHACFARSPSGDVTVLDNPVMALPVAGPAASGIVECFIMGRGKEIPLCARVRAELRDNASH